MYGIIIYQAYEYFRLYRMDTMRLKILVRVHLVLPGALQRELIQNP